MENGVKKDRLLIIEDEPSVAKQLKWALGETYEIAVAGEAHTARKLLAAGAFAVATLDLGLPPHPDSPREGLTLLEELPALAPHTRIVVITGNSEQETALKAVALGAVDFCEKPIDLKILEIILSRTFRLQALETANRELRQQTNTCGALCGMLGVSPVMQTLFELIRKVSASDYPVLVTGESGTGVYDSLPKGKQALWEQVRLAVHAAILAGDLAGAREILETVPIIYPNMSADRDLFLALFPV